MDITQDWYWGVTSSRQLPLISMAMEPDLSARGSVDHSTAGAQIVWHSLNNLGTSQARHATEVLALCIASHHSGLIDCVKSDGSDDLSRRLNKIDANTHGA